MKKLSDYANQHGVCYRTAWNRYHAGKIKNSFEKDGHIYIDDEKIYSENSCVIYARVSSNENKANLETQVDRLTQFAIARGYSIINIYKEIGSGVNDERKILKKLLLSDDDFHIILVEHKDRLTRFGFNYLDLLLKKLGRKIEVVNLADNKQQDLLQDLVSVIYSFSAKLYGLRRTKRKTEQLIKVLQSGE